MKLPDYLQQGEVARLFPVLADTSKEGRTTSIFLSCLSSIDELAVQMLKSVGAKVGKRASLTCFTEVVFKGEKDAKNDRPDGLIVLKNGSKEWRALIETKVGTAELRADQIEKYRSIAKAHDIDCVITISNQFTSLPANHPMREVQTSKSKIPVYHWSWMFIVTEADLLINTGSVVDADQLLLLRELRRFLTHESAGVRGFTRMPAEWSELNKLVSAGGKISQRSQEAQSVIGAWHQETKDLSLILSRQTETSVSERLKRAHQSNIVLRDKEALEVLRDTQCLKAIFDIPNAAAPLELYADMKRRTIDVGMTLSAPRDKKSSKARANWLLRQISTDQIHDLYVRMTWPGRSEDTQFTVKELLEDVSICEIGKQNLQVLSFFVFNAKRLGARFTQQSNFIVDLEKVVPQFYQDVGQSLTEWRASAPKIKADRQEATDVSIEALEEESTDAAAE
ncbi:hypothetical protein [Yoonia algicola]|uniref:Stress response protein n=1 Tax=Yoonia algicola TaxID=3137368 RepID=A0AAN0NF42_9RHOB